MLFTSARGETQTDIYRFDVAIARDDARHTDARERILRDRNARRQALLGHPRRSGHDATALELRERRQRSQSCHRSAQAGRLSRVDRREQCRVVRAGEPERPRPHRRAHRKIRHAGARHRPVADAAARQEWFRVRAARRLDDVDDHRDDVAGPSDQRSVRAPAAHSGSRLARTGTRAQRVRIERSCRGAPARRRGRRSAISPPPASPTSRAWRSARTASGSRSWRYRNPNDQ